MSAHDDETQVDLDTITNMAKRLVKGGKLKESEVTAYVHDHMTGLGYQSKRSYYRESKSTGKSSSGFSFLGSSRNDDDDD